MKRKSPHQMAQHILASYPPADILAIWYALTGALTVGYKVDRDNMIACVRGYEDKPDGTRDYAFAVKEPTPPKGHH